MNKEEILKYINSSDDFVVNGKRYCENDFYNDVEDLVKENKKYKEVIKEIIEYLQSKEFEENFPYVANECQVRSAILNIVVERIMTADFNKLLDILKEVE